MKEKYLGLVLYDLCEDEKIDDDLIHLSNIKILVKNSNKILLVPKNKDKYKTSIKSYFKHNFASKKKILNIQYIKKNKIRFYLVKIKNYKEILEGETTSNIALNSNDYGWRNFFISHKKNISVLKYSSKILKEIKFYSSHDEDSFISLYDIYSILT